MSDMTPPGSTGPIRTTATSSKVNRAFGTNSESSLNLQSCRRLFQLIAIGYLLVATLPVILPNWWLADLLANLRVQLLIAAVPMLLATWVGRRKKTLFCLAILTGYHLSWFVSPAPVSSTDAAIETAAIETAITVMAANVWTDNQKYELIERQFRESNCDVVVISELSFGLADYLREGFAHDYTFHLEYPADRGNFGIGIYSRLPLKNASVEFLTNDSVPTVFADVEANGKSFHLIGVHTLPPLGKQMFEHRNRHLQLVADHVRKLRVDHVDLGVIVLGDLNLTPWSSVFTNFLNAASLRQAVSGSRLQPTWYRWQMFPFGLVLDHVLLSEDLACVSRTIGQSAGSDHRFVTVEVGLDSAD